MTHRVTHEIRVGIGGQFAPVQENLPVRKVLAKNYDQRRSLNDLQRVGISGEIEARTEREAMDGGRVVFAEVLLPLFGQSLCPREDLSRLQITGDIAL
jgi:hypothetical protein